MSSAARRTPTKAEVLSSALVAPRRRHFRPSPVRAVRRPPVVDHLAALEQRRPRPGSRQPWPAHRPPTCVFRCLPNNLATSGYTPRGMGGTSPAGHHRTSGRTDASDFRMYFVGSALETLEADNGA